MSQNSYYKKYLKYKIKYNNLKNNLARKYIHKPTILIKHSLIQTITSELHLEKDIKKVTTIDSINFKLNIDKVYDILRNYPKDKATKAEKYIIDLNLCPSAQIKEKLSQNHQHNLLMELYFTLGNVYSLESNYFNKIYENLDLLDKIEIYLINYLNNLIADEKLSKFYNIDIIKKWKQTIINKQVEKTEYYKISKLSDEDKNLQWKRYEITWDKFNNSCLKIKDHLSKIEQFYETQKKIETIGCYNIDKELYLYCLESHLGIRLDVQKLEEFALKELDMLVIKMKKLLKKIEPNINTEESHITLIKKIGTTQLYKSKEEFIVHHQEVIDKYYKKFIKELQFKNYDELHLIAFSNANLAGGYYFDDKFYLNCSNWHETYKYVTESLILHEAYPGHHLQVHSMKYSNEENNLFYSYFYEPTDGFCEGWGLFSEELGYEQTLWDKVGQIEFEIFRTLRIIVDIRIHYKGYKPKEIFDYMRKYSSLSEGEITSEVYRYCSLPGQAVSYKVGKQIFKKIVNSNNLLSDESIKLYKEIIFNGPMPLGQLLEKYNIDVNNLFS